MATDDDVTAIRQLMMMPQFVASDQTLSEEKRMMQILQYFKTLPMRADFIREMRSTELENFRLNHPDASYVITTVELNRRYVITVEIADGPVMTFWFNIPAHLSVKE